MKHIVPLIAAILAAAVLFIATPHGIGITSDSIVYITVARSIVSGHGWTFFGAPVTLWPPLYPSLLSVAGLIGFDVIEGARWLQIVIWGWNIFWIGFIAFRFSRGSIAASLAACCLTLGAVDLLRFHAIALSEGAFLLFILPGMYALWLYTKQRRLSFLVLAAVLLGLASLTRYVGLYWIIAGTAIILFLDRTYPPRKRIRDGALFGMIGVLPGIAWMLRNAQYHTLTGRTFDLHSIFGERELQSLFYTLSGWFSQWVLPASPWFLLLAAVLLFWWFFSATGQRSLWGDTTDGRWPLVIFITVHTAGLLLTAAFSQAQLLRDIERQVIPVHAMLVMLVVTSVSIWYRKDARPRASKTIAAAAGAAVCIFVLVTGASYVLRLRIDALGYASRAYQNSPLIARVKAVPPGVSIYSNVVPPLYLYTGRPVNLLPQRTNVNTGRSNEKYMDQMQRMAADIRDSSAVLAYFDRGDSWSDVPALEEIHKLVPLRCRARESDGGLYDALPDTTNQQDE